MSEVVLSFKDPDTFKLDVGPRDTPLCQQVPGMRASKLDPRRAEVEWTCPATWYHANVIRAVFRDRLAYDGDVMLWAFQQAQAEQDRLDIKTRAVPPGGPLYDYQKTGVNWIFDGNAILADDMGLGKTVQALQALEYHKTMFEDNKSDAVVVTTGSMQYKWAEECRKWAPSWNPVVVDGSAAKRRKAIETAPANSVFILTWGSLRTHTRLAGYGSVTLTAEEKSDKELNRRSVQYVIADEAHRALDPQTKQTRALWYLGRRAHRRWALTGTPVKNNQNEAWALLHFCDPVVWASRSEFQSRYVYGWEADWGFEPRGWQASNEPEVMRFIDQYLLRRVKAEVGLDLPPKTYERRLLELTPKQAKAYKSMKKELLAEVDGKLLSAGDPLTKLGRLSQIASATPVIQDVEQEDGSLKGEVVALDAPSNKVDALIDLLDEGDDQIVVFAASKKLINLVGEKLDKKGVTYARITGDESAAERALSVQQFQEGLCRVVLCTFGAGSEGITLTAASTVAFLQRPWSLVQSRQAEDRVHRIGQEAEHVRIIDFVSVNTVDEDVYKALVEKGEAMESVVRDEARLREMTK